MHPGFDALVACFMLSSGGRANVTTSSPLVRGDRDAVERDTMNRHPMTDVFICPGFNRGFRKVEMRSASLLRYVAWSGVAVLGSLAFVPSAGASDLPPASTPSPAHWWKADGTAADSVLADNGTLFNGATYGSGVSGGGTDQAFSFDGSGAFVQFNAIGGDRGTADFTLAFDVKTTSAQHQAIWEKRPVCDAAHFWGIRMLQDGLVQGEIYQPGDTEYPVATTAVDDGSWHAVALTRHGVTASLYIDGTLESTVTSTKPINVSNNVDMVAGTSVCVGHDGTQPFNGALDELQIYRSALTPAQVTGLAAQRPS